MFNLSRKNCHIILLQIKQLKIVEELQQKELEKFQQQELEKFQQEQSEISRIKQSNKSRIKQSEISRIKQSEISRIKQSELTQSEKLLKQLQLTHSEKLQLTQSVKLVNQSQFNQSQLNQSQLNQSQLNQSQLNQSQLNQLKKIQPSKKYYYYYSIRYKQQNIQQQNIQQSNIQQQNIQQSNIQQQNIQQSNIQQQNIQQQNIQQQNIQQSNIKQSIIQQPIYSKIPLNIFQTWHTLDLPPLMKQNLEKLKVDNSEFIHYLYDDAMCRNFLKNNFDEDVLYTFDKLKPGAYKADLWRYCILYKYGGIYLDIKYYCINGFKLINLTDKEYYVRDRENNYEIGIYQALLSCYPNNKIMYQSIYKIVENVKNNIYGISSLHITGPHLLSIFFMSIEIKNMKLNLEVNGIQLNNNYILQYYKEYRKEQQLYQKLNHYGYLWETRNVYNYPILKTNNKINLTRKIIKNIMGKNIEFYSGTPTIIEQLDNTFLINIKWSNINYNENGSQVISQNLIILNSRFNIDNNFKKISDEIFLDENINIDDIKIFNYNNEYFYLANTYDNKHNIISISSNKYIINNNSYKLDDNIINSTIFDLNNINKSNWSFVIYKNDLCVVYDWFPLQIGKIDYTTHRLNTLIIKYNIPEFFIDTKGSTNGIIYNNEIWFIAYKTQIFYINKMKLQYLNYQHFFAIFDLNMNLIRYSELFKFDDYKIEFCIGLIIKKNKLILSYNLLNTQSIIATYDIDYINKNIKWYMN